MDYSQLPLEVAKAVGIAAIFAGCTAGVWQWLKNVVALFGCAVIPEAVNKVVPGLISFALSTVGLWYLKVDWPAVVLASIIAAWGPKAIYDHVSGQIASKQLAAAIAEPMEAPCPEAPPCPLATKEK